MCLLAPHVTDKSVTQIRVEETLWVEKDDPEAHLPMRAHVTDIRYDLRTLHKGVVPAHDQWLVDTGLCIEQPALSCDRITSRSGLTLKHGLTVGAGVIDPDYRGEVQVILFNQSTVTHRIIPGMRIAQIIFEQAITPDIVHVKELDKTERGDKGFGSTDAMNTSEGSIPDIGSPSEAPLLEEDCQLLRRFIRTKRKLVAPRMEARNKFRRRTAWLSCI
ncbi:dUTPase-like protein [Wolfiporia cocos MD-104 SS10]|uniref:Deoxyuridine 5'-triphosphate nucleotidohydrolase n=1 Tax=Wolfiporia cocos (strain MD-104) TaxID=742152 RepID=A0A2H3IZI9_WOLCO|nr:dUTPase-like protein [Wolfiporia cocos MD-104 SS10]